jgi:hypothetical protein
MNFNQIRMFAMLIMLFGFGMIWSCSQAHAVESAGNPQAVQLNTSPEVRAALEDLGVLCITGQIVVVNPKSGDVLQIWKPYKQPDGTYIALPAMCGPNEEGTAAERR